MGSGCTTNNNSSKCFSITATDCVQYVGTPYSSLSICTNDTATEVIEEIANNLLNIVDGTGVTPSVTATCSTISQQLAGIALPNLNQYLNAIVTTVCTNVANITTLTNQVNTPVTYTNPGCLTMPSVITTPGVLQATINQLCSLTTQVSQLTTTVDAGPTLTPTIITQINNIVSNYLATNVLSCANKGRSTSVDTNGNTIVQFNAMVPPMCPIPFLGDASYFDSTGIGLASKGMCGWYVCNGNNGTPDMRGYVFGGATSIGITGPALDNIVDPVYNNDPDYATTIGQKKGEVKHKLVANEEAPHTHPLTDNGHTHGVFSKSPQTINGGNLANTDNTGAFNAASPTDISYTGITMGVNTPSGTPHENRQPTIYGMWIIRLS